MNEVSDTCRCKCRAKGDTAEEQLSDGSLLRQVGFERNEKAFEIIYTRYERRVLALAIRCTGRRDVAEEVLQVAMLQVWRSANSFRKGTVEQWIFRIAVNECRRNYHRTNRRRRRESHVGRRGPWNTYGDPFEEEQKQENWTQLKAAMHSLPVPDRKLATWYYGLGFTQERIARMFGMAPRTVSYQLRKVLVRLRKSMGCECA